jgi:hypothetical protein
MANLEVRGRKQSWSILRTNQAHYQKGLIKTAINLCTDFEYEAGILPPLDGEIWPMFRYSFQRFSLISYTVITRTLSAV